MLGNSSIASRGFLEGVGATHITFLVDLLLSVGHGRVT